MIVCLCNGINDKVINYLINNGYDTVKKIKDKCGACNDCKKCATVIQNLIKKQGE